MRRLSMDELRLMELFRKLTNVNPVDCFSVQNQVVFTTQKGFVPKAIGKGGRTIKQLRDTINKDIQVIELADDPISMVKNFMFPIIPKEIQNEENTINITFKTGRERRLLLNNQQQGLKTLKEIIQRYFRDIEDVRVL